MKLKEKNRGSIISALFIIIAASLLLAFVVVLLNNGDKAKTLQKVVSTNNTDKTNNQAKTPQKSDTYNKNPEPAQNTNQNQPQENQPSQSKTPQLNNIPQSPIGRHVILDLYPEHYSYLKDMNLWVGQLDDAYKAYQDLVGQTPFGGDKITIKAVPENPGGEMVAGNPVKWYDIYISDKLKSVSNNNDLSFGPIHELGHDFDINWQYYIGSSNFTNAENWANFKLTYVADTLSAKYPDATFYQISSKYLKIGEFSYKYFYEKYAKPWIDSGRTDWQNMNSDTYTGLLYSIKEQIGWEPFKKTFRDYATFTSDPPSSDLGKVELFARTLSKNAGIDLTPQFRKWGFEVYPQ